MSASRPVKCWRGSTSAISRSRSTRPRPTSPPREPRSQASRPSSSVQQATIDAAKATIDVDQATATFAAQENKRYSDLAATGYGSVQNAQQAQSRIAGAQAAIQRDTANLASALKQVDLLKAEIVQAGAALARAEAVQSQAQLNLDYTSIIAPIDGVVGNRTLRTGQFVQAGTQLMSVVPVAGAYVVANFKETQLTDVRKGQAVDIAVDMFPGQLVHGHVDSIAPASGQEFALLPPDNATGNFTKVVQRIPVKIALNRDTISTIELRPGMSVIPTIETKVAGARDAIAASRISNTFPEDRAMSDLALSASTPLTSGGATPDPNRASTATWIAVLAAMIGSFMAILNIQITNASLLNIEGGIGTGVDNGSWISTSYLIGEIIVIPLTDYLSRVFSFRRYMLASSALFAVFSVACAFTHDLPSMIAMRGLQGFAGGVLIPMAFTLVLTKLPKPQQPIGLAVFALSVTFAPAIGPTIGGYLTENYGWRTIFFVNVLPTIVMVSALYLTLERQPMQLKLLKEGDWAGIAAMAIGLSALQTVLEEGNKDDWFSSPFILRLAAIALVSLSLFVAIELTIEKPLIRLRLLTQRNFGFGTMAMTMVGFALFGSVYILPAYLGQAQGYNAEQIGGGVGMDRPAPTDPDSAGAEADAAVRYALRRLHRTDDIRLQLLHEHGDVARLCRRPAMDSEHRARHRPGHGAHAADLGDDRRHRSAGCGRGIGHQQHAPQSRRRHRYRGARHRDHQARAVPLQHHRPVGHAGSRGSTQPDRANDKLFHGPWCAGSRSGASAGHHCARQSSETPGAGDGLQRHVRGDRRRAGTCRHRGGIHAQGQGIRGRSPLSRSIEMRGDLTARV